MKNLCEILNCGGDITRAFVNIFLRFVLSVYLYTIFAYNSEDIHNNATYVHVTSLLLVLY